jgi:flagellar biosynthesis/type III secretory pathway ATPase
MRLAITLTRTGDTWQVKHMPSVPLGEQLADFKAKQVAGEFTADETLVVSLNDTLKRYAKKPSSIPVAVEDAPKKKK